MSSTDDEALLALAAREAGLEMLLDRDPDLLARARKLALGYAERLPRPEAPGAEPAHVYRAPLRT